MDIGTDKTFAPGPNRVFVFGSNRAGVHGAGAAAYAHREHGAEYGVGEGLRGSSYALPSKDERIATLPLHEIRGHVDTFIALAKERPDLEFFVTRVGCGLAGLTDAQVGPMFCGAPKNVELPHGWGGKLLDRKEDGVGWKCVRADYTDFYSGTFRHAVGVNIEIAEVDRRTKLCAPGILHASRTLRQAISVSRGSRNAKETYPWRFFRVRFDREVASDSEKVGVHAYLIEKEYTLTDIFDHVLGADFIARVDTGREEIADWKLIPWFKPTKVVTEADVAPILARWHDAIAPYHAQRGLNRDIPRKARIITDRNVAIQAAKDWRPAADAAADAADAAAAAAAAADADADAAAAAAAAAAADAAAAAAAADAAAAAAAADADADADADAAALWPYWASWNLRPRWAMYRAWRWRVFGLKTPNPWEPIVELYKLGVAPIGYRSIDGEVVFVVYAPAVQP